MIGGVVRVHAPRPCTPPPPHPRLAAGILGATGGDSTRCVSDECEARFRIVEPWRDLFPPVDPIGLLVVY
jgi:hypothetical protein